MSEQLKKREMKKNLGWATATSIVVGCVIGAGVFFKPYAIYQATGGAPGMGMLAWLVGGLMSIFGALTFAEVAILIPKTGGMVTYLTEAFDERLGFLAGWMQVVIFYPAFLAGYGVKVGTELAEYLGGWGASHRAARHRHARGHQCAWVRVGGQHAGGGHGLQAGATRADHRVRLPAWRGWSCNRLSARGGGEERRGCLWLNAPCRALCL